jgi:FPC/CPF motif-containing protein YcgG|tara:strand:- start:3996 stop:4250 length:255 start_codon:yes stop_codon:yes gene_type:complete
MKRKKKNKKAEKEFNQALWNNLKEQHTKSEADEALLESLKIIEDLIDEVSFVWTDTGDEEKLKKIERKLDKINVAFHIIKANLR